MDGEDVRAPEDLVDALGALDLAGQQPGVLHADRRVVSDDAQPQAQGGVGHLNADGAQADDPQRAPRQLEADEALLAGLDGGGDGGVVALEGVGEAGYG